MLYGARMHIQIDGTDSCMHSFLALISIVDAAANRFDGILDAIMTRYNVCRIYGVITVDVSTVFASSCTGPVA